MSDFLGRVAARAAGRPAAARPRVPTLFERADTTREGALELVDEEVVAPVRHEPARSAPPPPADRNAAPAPAPAQRVRTSNAPEVAPRAPTRAPEPSPTATVSGPSAVKTEREVAAAPRLPLETAVPSAEIAPRPAAAIVPLTPARPEVSARGRAAPLPLPVPRDEPPPVRVHIGRLEIRANLQQAAQEHPRPEAPRPEGLPLADYLRGKR